MQCLTTGAANNEIKSKMKFWRQSFSYFEIFLMFHQIFLSPEVKQSTIVSNKHGIYKLPQELPNDLRLRKLGY